MLDHGARPLNLVGRKHPALRTPAVPVEHADPTLHALAGRMWATLRRSQGGLALAACQVGVPVALVVAANGSAYANLRFEADLGAAMVTGPEGCLSLPGRWFAVPRAARVRVTGIDVTAPGREQIVDSLVTDELPARMFSHEVDHLSGLLICDQWPEIRIPHP